MSKMLGNGNIDFVSNQSHNPLDLSLDDVLSFYKMWFKSSSDTQLSIRLSVLDSCFGETS